MSKFIGAPTQPDATGLAGAFWAPISGLDPLMMAWRTLRSSDPRETSEPGRLGSAGAIAVAGSRTSASEGVAADGGPDARVLLRRQPGDGCPAAAAAAKS